MPDFELRLLGPFELVHRTKGHVRVRPGRLRALLARLAFRPGRSRTRGDLAGLLWNGRPEHAARHSLNQALSELRRTTSQALFVQDGEHLALNAGVITCDIDQVRSLLREGSIDSLNRAVELCRGPFLDGIDLSLPEFDDWLRTARTEADELTTAVYEYLLANLTEVPDAAAKTEDIALQLIEIDPLNEYGHRALIEAAATRGHTDRAIRLYSAYQQRLADELGVLPGQDIRQLVRRLRRSPTQPGVNESAASGTEHSARPVVFVGPFRTITTSGHDLAIADGVTHDLITELGRFRSLDVIAAETALACRDSAESLSAIGERFEVDYVLSGSLRCNTDSARLSIELAETQGDRQLWSERYDCALGELFDVRDDVVTGVAAAAASRIEHDCMRRVRRKPTNSWEAYDYFIRALDIYYRRWSAPDAPQACKPLFEKAVELDPEFARGHAFLACVNAHMGKSDRVDEDFSTSIGCARRAMTLDPLEADAFRVLGAIYVTVGHHEEGYRQLSRAVRLNPGNADLAAHMSRYYCLTGDAGRALVEIERARRLNPWHPDWYWTIAAMAHHTDDDYGEALRALHRMRETTGMEHLYAAACHAALGDADRAREQISRVLSDMPALTVQNVDLYLPYAETGKREQLLDQLARAELPQDR